MRIVRIGAVVLAILGGVYAVLGYAMVVRDQGGSDAALGSVWLLVTGILAIVIVGLAVLASPRNAQNDERVCPACERRADEDWNLCPACGTPLPPPTYEVAPRPVGDEQAEGEWPADDYESKAGLLGTVLFWLGMLVLDVLFVLLALWIFVPALALAQRIFLFWSLAGIGIGCIIAGSSLAPRSTIRL